MIHHQHLVQSGLSAVHFRLLLEVLGHASEGRGRVAAVLSTILVLKLVWWSARGCREQRRTLSLGWLRLYGVPCAISYMTHYDLNTDLWHVVHRQHIRRIILLVCYDHRAIILLLNEAR